MLRAASRLCVGCDRRNSRKKSVSCRPPGGGLWAKDFGKMVSSACYRRRATLDRVSPARDAQCTHPMRRDHISRVVLAPGQVPLSRSSVVWTRRRVVRVGRVRRPRRSLRRRRCTRWGARGSPRRTRAARSGGQPLSRTLMILLTLGYAGRAPCLRRASSGATATWSVGLVRFVRAPASSSVRPA